MQLDILSADDRAVASMLGVTLLLGTAVVGAAVVGAFVLDMGGGQAGSSTETSQAPQVQWEWHEGGGDVVVEHRGGDTVDAERLMIAGDVDPLPADTSLDDGGVFGDGSVSSGDEATIDGDRLDDGGTLALIWSSEDGSQAVVLSEYDYDTR